MDPAGLLLFIGVYLMATFSPGPAAAAVIARTLTTGLRSAWPFIAGIVVGDLVWFALVALGLAALARNFHVAFVVIQYAGAAYLLFLAYKLWTAPAAAPSPSPLARGEGVKLFLGGLALTMGNPKVMVFFVSILPLVVDLQAITTIAALQVSALIVLILTFAMGAYAVAADRARRLIATPEVMRLVNRSAGVMMAGAAAAVAARA